MLVSGAVDDADKEAHPSSRDCEWLCAAAIRAFLREPDAMLQARIAAGTQAIASYAGLKAHGCPLMPYVLGSDLSIIARDFYLDVHRAERHGALGPAARECVFLMCCRYVERNGPNALKRPLKYAVEAKASIAANCEYPWPRRAQFYHRLQHFERDVRERYAFRDEPDTLEPPADVVARYRHADMLAFYLDWESASGYPPSEFGATAVLDDGTLAHRRIQRFLTWMVVYVCLADRVADGSREGRVITIAPCTKRARRHVDDDDE